MIKNFYIKEIMIKSFFKNLTNIMIFAVESFLMLLLKIKKKMDLLIFND